jgi:hypothetical protein
VQEAKDDSDGGWQATALHACHVLPVSSAPASRLPREAGGGFSLGGDAFTPASRRLGPGDPESPAPDDAPGRDRGKHMLIELNRDAKASEAPADDDDDETTRSLRTRAVQPGSHLGRLLADRRRRLEVGPAVRRVVALAEDLD